MLMKICCSPIKSIFNLILAGTEYTVHYVMELKTQSGSNYNLAFTMLCLLSCKLDKGVLSYSSFYPHSFINKCLFCACSVLEAW